MVFITVGNANQGFRRLLDAVDALTRDGLFGCEPVFIQTGHNPDFHPLHCGYRSFLPVDEFQQWLEKSDLIICHGGCTALSVVRLGKVPVVMPRREKYGEHVNDHQLQFVQALAAEGRVIPAYEPQDLPQATAEARRRNVQPVPLPPSRMLSLVVQAVDELVRREG